MAKATKKLLTPVVQPYELVLTLTEAEASTLNTVLRRVGGSAETTRRKYADSICLAMTEAGVADVETEDISATQRSIWFI